MEKRYSVCWGGEKEFEVDNENESDNEDEAEAKFLKYWVLKKFKERAVM